MCSKVREWLSNVTPYLSHSFVMVTLCNRYIMYYINPYGGYVIDIHFPSHICGILHLSLILNPYGGYVIDIHFPSHICGILHLSLILSLPHT